MPRLRSLLGLVAGLTLAVGIAPAAVAADPVTVAWIPDSPFIVFADHGRETAAEPTFSVVNATSALVRVEATIQLDPPEIVGPEDAARAHCTQALPFAGETTVGTCFVPIATQQVTDGTVIEATIAWRAFDDADTPVASGTTAVLDVSAVRASAELSVAIDPLPPTVLVAPADQSIEYNIENIGTVDLDDVSLEVEIQGANRTPGRTVCEVDAGPLAVGATHHETCVVSLTEADAGDHPVRVLVVARGTGAGQATLDEEIVLLPLVLPGAHVEVYLLEIGLNDTRPAPGDTVVLEVQIYNVGSETLDVATRTDPNAPDCARVLESVTAAEVRSFECDFLIPADATVCLLPYTVFALGVASDGQTVEASIDSLAGLTQPDDLCGSGGGALPATATVTHRVDRSGPAGGSLGLAWLPLLLVAGLIAALGDGWRRRHGRLERG